MKKFVAIHLHSEGVTLYYFQIAEAKLGINPLRYLSTKFMRRKIVKDLDINIDLDSESESLAIEEVPDLTTVPTV